MTTKLMNNLELIHIAGGVGRWYDIYTPWFSVGDKVTYKKFPSRYSQLRLQGSASQGKLRRRRRLGLPGADAHG